jgi:hypothetical protein
MSDKVINVIDKAGDYNGHLFVQWLVHWRPVLARNVEDMVDGIIARAKTLATIELLRLFGHGSPGDQGMGCGMSAGTAATNIAVDGTGKLNNQKKLLLLKPYFAKGAVVQLHGCEVGAGSAGRQLLTLLADLWDVRVQAAIFTQYPNLFQDEFEGSYWEADGSGGGTPVLRFYHA